MINSQDIAAVPEAHPLLARCPNTASAAMYLRTSYIWECTAQRKVGLASNMACTLSFLRQACGKTGRSIEVGASTCQLEKAVSHRMGWVPCHHMAPTPLQHCAWSCNLKNWPPSTSSMCKLTTKKSICTRSACLLTFGVHFAPAHCRPLHTC